MAQIGTINATLLNNRKGFTILIILWIFGGTLLTLFLAIQLHQVYIILIGISISFGAPFVFKTQFRKHFSKKAQLIFYDDYFLVELFNIKTGALESERNVHYNELKFYKTYDAVKNDFSSLKLIFLSGEKITYLFSGQTDDDNQTNVTSMVRNKIRSYNLSKASEYKIKLAPNLFATKAGLYSIIVLTILLVVAIILQILYKPKTIPLSLIVGLSMYLQIWFQRKKDLKNVSDNEN